jgi:hypothetical protein
LAARVDIVDEHRSGEKPSEVPWLDVRLKPIPGILYRIGSIEVVGVAGSDLAAIVQKDIGELLPRFVANRARADILSHLEDEIIWRVRNAAHPFVRVVGREILPDQATHMAGVRITIDPGPSVRFGSVVFRGLGSLDPHSLSRYVPFSPGNPYRSADVDALREELGRLPFVRSVGARLNDAPDWRGLWNVEVDVKEIPPKPGQVLRSGLAGLTTMCAALAALALRQVALAFNPRSRSRSLRTLTVIAWALVFASAAFVMQRLLTYMIIS